MPNVAKVNQPLERPASLKDASYAQIKNLLLTEQLERDKLYSAQYFADRLGVSRTPVREALLQLASEGFLICKDVRGFQIKDFSDKEIKDVFETRQLIESHLIKRLVEEGTTEDFRQMEQCVKRMSENAARHDEQAFLEADKEFHMIPVRRCGNAHLASIMESIRNHMALFGVKALMHRQGFQEVIQEHTAILDALRHKDKKKAIQAMGNHLSTTEQHLLAETAT